MGKNKGGIGMFEYLKNLWLISATFLIGIAESSATMMCVSLLDEIELPEELKNGEF